MIDFKWSPEYLKTSRTAMWNDDYMEFLIERVWKISKPVDIVDFGCGIGYLGSLIMPLLPKGSTYTGVDHDKDLLDKAAEIFSDSPYKTYFIKSDMPGFKSGRKFDIAMCQTVLQHIPDAYGIVENMRDSVVNGGLVICIEIDITTALAAQYYDGINHSKICNLTNYEKLIEKGVEDKKSNGNIGMRVPVLLQRAGLNDVGIRVNDYVQFINPLGDPDKHECDIKAYMSHAGAKNPGEKESCIAWYKNKGYTDVEAEEQYNCQLALYEYLNMNINSAFILNARCLFISYGTVRTDVVNPVS